MRALYAAALVVGFPAQAVVRAPAGSSIPFELQNGRIYVSAFVNGKGPYRFGFDTGASGMGRADTRLTTQLSLPKAGEAANSDGVRAVSSDVVSVGSLRIGNVEKRGVELLSRDYNKKLKVGAEPMMGIIGRDFMADRMVVIDYPARIIRFSSGRLKSGGAGVVPYGPSLSVPVCFKAGCFPGAVDTGSNRGIVVPKELAAKLALDKPVIVGQAARMNSVVTLHEATLQEPVRIAGVTAPHQKIIYTEPSIDKINIGSDFLKDYLVTIDQVHGLLRISKTAR